jgi:hypothetical protein
MPMHITLSPIRMDGTLALERRGDTLVFNGAALDLSAIPEGATLPAPAIDCPWITGGVERRDGALHLTLVLPHGPDAPPETLFPAPLVLTRDGPVDLPPHDALPENRDEA